MSRWQHIDTYRDAAKALNIDVFGPVDIELTDGEKIHAELHFPYFGNKNGTLVVEDYERIRSMSQKIIESDYALSSFGMVDGEVCSADDLAEMLSEWGWCGDLKNKPRWMK